MVVKIDKYHEYNNGNNDKPFKHISQQKESARYCQQQHPTNVPGI
jgi:hypothetical protein